MTTAPADARPAAAGRSPAGGAGTDQGASPFGDVLQEIVTETTPSASLATPNATAKPAGETTAGRTGTRAPSTSVLQSLVSMTSGVKPSPVQPSSKPTVTSGTPAASVAPAGKAGGIFPGDFGPLFDEIGPDASRTTALLAASDTAPPSADDQDDTTSSTVDSLLQKIASKADETDAPDQAVAPPLATGTGLPAAAMMWLAAAPSAAASPARTPDQASAAASETKTGPVSGGMLPRAQDETGASARGPRVGISDVSVATFVAPSATPIQAGPTTAVATTPASSGQAPPASVAPAPSASALILPPGPSSVKTTIAQPVSSVGDPTKAVAATKPPTGAARSASIIVAPEDAVSPRPAPRATPLPADASHSDEAHEDAAGQPASDAGPIDKASVAHLDPAAMPVPAALSGTVQRLASAIGELAARTAPVAADAAAPTTPAAPLARTLTLQMSPADLGTIDIKLHMAGDALDVELTVSDQRTLGVVSHGRDELASSLRDQSYQLNSLVIQDGSIQNGSIQDGSGSPQPGGHNATQHNSGGSTAGGDARQNASSGDPGASQKRGAERPPPGRRPADRAVAADPGGGALLV